MKISIIDYKMGNIKSVYNALKFLKSDPVIVDKPSKLTGDKIVIPGGTQPFHYSASALGYRFY